MRVVRWVRFNWDLGKLSAHEIDLPPHYHLGAATSADEVELRAVITRSFAHDNSWGDAIHEVNSMVDGWLERAFAPEKEAHCLALRHGLRIIGAAISIPDTLGEEHLAPGPCVLMEYRNRGLGSALLRESLRQLREAGLPRATARARSSSLAAKFLYPKFNGTPMPDEPPLVAA